MTEVKVNTDRLVFINKTIALISDYLELVNDKDNVGNFIGVEKVYDEDEEVQYVYDSLKDNLCAFSMIEIKTGDFIGNIDLKRCNSEKSAELGIAIPAKKQCQGFGTEAIHGILKYGFEVLELDEVWLKVFRNNTRAKHVYSKCGFHAYKRDGESIFMYIKRSD